ncbi:MAG: 3-hydroxyacyl-[acyl-carrier-protein] dehydratase FabA, partial [Psychrosphaera sp.]|nr:3-hydroxyacyl-[acyl-carrier-protein] dehydratase FabA [Psychrosphaera sp.]
YRGRVNLSTQIEESLLQQGVELSDEQRDTLTNIAKDGVASAAQLNQYTSFIGNIMASRISALWDFSGPAFTLSGEENSVYRCVELAENLFQTSDVDAVIIAGVDLAGSIENITLRQHFGPVNVDANTDNAEQWLVGEGAAAFVVKPKSKAPAQNVYACIDAVSFADSTSRAADQALTLAGLSSADISAVEAHASGFAAENEAENAALATLYRGKPVSSVKANIGHTFNASGVASIIKSALLLNDSLDSEQNTKIAINGLGRDESCAHLILSSTEQPHQAGLSNLKKRPQLIKTITLGGQSIFNAIAGDEQLNTVKSAFAGKTLKPVARPVDISNLAPKLNTYKETLNPINTNSKTQSVLVQTPAAVGATVKSKASKAIYQQAATHQAFLSSRQVAQQQISTLIG